MRSESISCKSALCFLFKCPYRPTGDTNGLNGASGLAEGRPEELYLGGQEHITEVEELVGHTDTGSKFRGDEDSFLLENLVKQSNQIKQVLKDSQQT